MIEKFKADTGIAINLSTFGSDDEAEQKLKAAGGSGFDVIFPSVTNILNYRGDGDDFLLAAIDESRVNMDNIIASMVRDSIQLGGVQRGNRLGLPFDWGTEAVTFNSSVLPLADDEVYAYILFMVFPVYNTIETLDPNQIEAAKDLGASTLRTHLRVVLPHAKPGHRRGFDHDLHAGRGLHRRFPAWSAPVSTPNGSAR